VLVPPDIHQACHHVLRKHLKNLADAKDDDLAWGTALAKANFKHEEAATNLRALLNDCDAQAVVALAERLL
jgi:hypothetical protein